LIHKKKEDYRRATLQRNRAGHKNKNSSRQQVAGDPTSGENGEIQRGWFPSDRERVTHETTLQAKRPNQNQGGTARAVPPPQTEPDEASSKTVTSPASARGGHENGEKGSGLYSFSLLAGDQRF